MGSDERFVQLEECNSAGMLVEPAVKQTDKSSSFGKLHCCFQVAGANHVLQRAELIVQIFQVGSPTV